MIGDLQTRLSEEEQDELERILEGRRSALEGPLEGSLTRIHGFLTSVLSGPIIMPSEWMPMVLGNDDDDAWETIEQAQHTMSLLMRFHNSIASDLRGTGPQYGILLDRLGDDDDATDIGDDWCVGYVLGIGLRKEDWIAAMHDPELTPAFVPIMMMAQGDPAQDDYYESEAYQQMLDALPQSVLTINRWWRDHLPAASPLGLNIGTIRRTSPKISPNEPCPCGSGKKYKRCCSPLRSA